MAGRANYSEKEGEVIKNCFLLNKESKWEGASNPLKRYSTIRKGPVYTSSSFSVITDPNGMDFNIYTGKNPKPLILAKIT